VLTTVDGRPVYSCYLQEMVRPCALKAGIDTTTGIYTHIVDEELEALTPLRAAEAWLGALSWADSMRGKVE